jgi:prepilin-type N-terminal cleavage/methylation domain-containing protein
LLLGIYRISKVPNFLVIPCFWDILEHMNLLKDRETGFTLVEVMVAMAIFAIVIASGFACLRSGMGLVENARHHTRAAQIMQSEIERIRSLPWNNVIVLTDDADVALATEFSGAAYDAYTMRRVVSGSGDERVVTLGVDWTDVGGHSHTRAYKSQYTKGGLYDYIQ